MRNEEFRELRGYKEIYLIGNCGTIKRKRMCNEYQDYIYKWTIIPTGYAVVGLNLDGKSRGYRVHRLVALMWCDNPEPESYIDVNHIDGNKLNNAAHNLEWCDRSMNIKHAYTTGLKTAVYQRRPLSSRTVSLIRNNYIPHDHKWGVEAWARRLRVSKKYIHDVIHWRVYRYEDGFQWFLSDDINDMYLVPVEDWDRCVSYEPEDAWDKYIYGEDDSDDDEYGEGDWNDGQILL